MRTHLSNFISSHQMNNGLSYVLRPIEAFDETMLKSFHVTLSEDTIQKRYRSSLSLEMRTNHADLARRCVIDYSREFALVAVTHYGDQEDMIVGVGRLHKDRNNGAELSFLVADAYQGQGVGVTLCSELLRFAQNEDDVDHIYAETMFHSKAMLAVIAHFPFDVYQEDGEVTATMKV